MSYADRSYSEFENWNPMADDYSCPTFNSYTNTLNPLHDPKSLYIKSVPADLEEDTFYSLFSDGGRRISRHILYPPRPGKDVTVGIVTFETEKDALQAKACLNKKPPLYMEVEYATISEKRMKANANYSRDTRNTMTNEGVNGRQVVLGASSHSRADVPGMSSDNHLATSSCGRLPFGSPGRGLLSAPGTSSVGHPATTGRGRSFAPGTTNGHFAGAGRGRAIASDALHSLKVVVQGDNKRVAYQNLESTDSQVESSYPPDLPELIPNLCLFCKKKGELSCGKCRQPYCSVDCQRQDWPKHKSDCKSLSTSISRRKQFANDSSYMSEGSSSDNDKKVNNNVPLNQINRNHSRSSSFQDVKAPVPRVTQTSPNSGIQKKFIKAKEVQQQKLSLNKNYKVSVCMGCSPSNFWIHLEGAEKALHQMEKEMDSVVVKVPVKCAVDDVCCTFENGKFKRVQILELTPNSATVKYIDYGGTPILLNNQLYFLPEQFVKYSAQAVQCNLVDGVSHRNVVWSDEEASSFEYHTKKEVFTGHVHGFVDDVYNIALMNEEGVSLYSILKDVGAFSQPKSSAATIPSVLSDLKAGAEVTVGAVHFEADRFWGFLENGSRADALKELQACLQKVETEDVTSSCKAGDVAVGFSPTLSQFYRCVILNRLMNNGFAVRYVDYGNTEKITKLQKLSPMLLQKKSFVICCERPPSLSVDDMKLIFETTCSVTVKTVNNMSVELSISFKNKPVVIRCFPWYHETTIAPSPKSNSSVLGPKTSNMAEWKSYAKCSQFPKKKISLSPNEKLFAKPKIPEKSVILIDLIPDKKLDPAVKHDVKIVWVKFASEIYVQLINDDNAINQLLLNINNYCNSEPCSGHSPIIDEVVCCKFSDNVWYRAQVIGKNKDRFKVFFIDYGNEAEVSGSNIKPLPQKFAMPKLSSCVSLHGIKNEDLNKELLDKFMEEIWSMELKDFKQKPAEVLLFLRGKPLSELIGKKNKRSKTLLQLQELPAGASEVVISYTEADKIYVHQQKDLKNILLLQTEINSLAKTGIPRPEIGTVYGCLSSDGCWYRGLVREILPKSVKVNYIDYGNDEEIPVGSLKEISDDLFSHPVYCLPLIVQNLKLQELKLETVFSVEVAGKKNGVQLVSVLNLPPAQTNPTISDLKTLSLEDGVNEVKFSFCEDGVFFCHLKKHLSDIDVMSQKLVHPELKPLQQAPSKGDLVCAKSSDDCWYRATVQSTSADSKHKVFFIDYGNCEDVPSENIQCLPKDLLNFPKFCIPVKITNIEKALNNIDMGSVLQVKTAGFSNDNVQLVELVLPSDKIVLPKSDSLKKQSLPVEGVVNVSLCHAQDDSLFVHMASSKESLSTLGAELIKASEFSDLPDLPEVGDLICAKFIDDVWYRGSVQRVSVNQKSCEICFIDYGNNEVISLENMKILPTSLCTFPVFSVPVKFKSMEKLREKIQLGESVFPIRVVESSDTVFVVDIALPEEDVEELSSVQCESLPESPIDVMVVHKEADVFYVQKISNAVKLQEMMADLQSPSCLKKLPRLPKVGELCNVKYEDGLFYRAVIKELCGENKFKAFFVDYGNVDVVESENVYCIPSKYSSVPGLCTAVKFNETGNANVSLSNPMCTLKYTGVSNDNVHIVELCPAVSSIPISSMKQNSLDVGVQEITFLAFDGEFHFLSKISDSAQINEMNSVLEKFEGDEISATPTVDEVLLVKCRNRWCRACVKAVDENSKTCKVFLIDCGTTEDVPFCDISYMPENLSAFPVFCIKVKIKNSTFTEGSVSIGKQYSSTVVGKTDDNVLIINIFKRYMLSSLKRQRLPLHELRNIVFYHQEGDIYFLQDVNDVALIAEAQAEVQKHASSDFPLSRNPIVDELLCAKSQADGCWYRCCVEEAVACDKWRIRFIDYGNNEIVMKENLRSFVGELAMYPAFSIPVKIVDSECSKATVQLEQAYSVQAESSDGNVQLVNLMLQHESRISVSPDDVPKTVESKNVETKEICTNPSDGESSLAKEMSALTTEDKYFYSTSDYVYFPDGDQELIIYSVVEECSLFCAPFNPDAITANLGLSSEITQYCEHLESSTFNRDSLPELDELVLAKYDADNQWYRAVVVDDSCHPFYDVIFVDYGNSERVSLDFMRKMEKDFMSLPIQAHLCSITGFITDENSLPTVIQELKKFGVFVSPTPLKASVSSKGEDKFVNIPVITKHLLEKKLVTALES